MTQVPVAIIGVGALFPGSPDGAGFWRDIVASRDLVSDVPPSHWLIEDYYDPDPSAPDKTYAKRGAFLGETPFDPMEFGVVPSSLPTTDSAQLLALIVAKRVLDDATQGRFASVDRSRIGVVLGVTSGQELLGTMVSRLQRPVWLKALRDDGVPEADAQRICDRITNEYVPWKESTFPGLLGNVVAGRIANRFDLGGTNCVTDAACASSLAALSIAINELALGQSDLVVTGGVDTMNDILMYTCFSKTPALSKSGDCRPFSEAADGTLLGEGLAMFALKRLTDAERDGDRVYAVIRGLGSSSDGRSKSVYAPVPEGQAKALVRAYEAAGYGADTVELVEAHGTATKAGDAAEFGGLKIAFEQSGRADHQWCALGSVKSQIGHTKSAAGAAGLFKAVMALHHKVLPPTIKVDRPNPELAIEQSPFYLNTQARPWVRNPGHPRRASVSSFGFGGSNFHVTLEEYAGSAAAAPRLRAAPTELFLISAPAASELAARGAKLAEMADKEGTTTAARASQQEFQASDHARLSIVASDVADLRAKLAQAQARIAAQPAEAFSTPTGVHFAVGATPGDVAFLFPGQGSQYVGMGADVAMEHNLAIDAWDTAAGLVETAALRDVVFPKPAFTDEDRAEQARRLTATEWAQPAIATASLALHGLLRAIGVHPACVAGHSLGELTALAAADALSSNDLVAVARKRGELMGAVASAPGAMTAVARPIDEVKALLARLGSEVVVANHNHPTQVVLAGEIKAIEAVEAELARQGITAKRLPVATAFHSQLVAGATAPFAEYLAGIAVKAPACEVFSNSEAAAYPSSPDAVRALLAGQITQSVRFVEVVEAMWARGARIFVEVGPSAVLTELVSRILGDRPHAAIALDRKGKHGVTALQDALGRLAAAGVAIDFAPLWAPFGAPAAPKRVPAMTMLVSGANYGKIYPPKGGAAALPPPNPERPVAAPPPISAAPIAVVHAAHVAPVAHAAPIEARPPARSDAVRAPAPVYAPVAVAVNGQLGLIEAYQESQRQLTEAHASYVRTMATGHEMFLTTMEASFVGLGGLLGAPVTVATHAPRMVAAASFHAPAPVVASAPIHALAPVHAPASVPAPAASIAVASVAVPVAPTIRSGAAPMAIAAAPVDLQALLLDVVADKTGYPAEMLAMHMELEADLGIDSIKRVEILSAMRKRAPNLPEVVASEMATLRTLGQIADYMQARSGAPAAAIAVAPEAPAAAPGIADLQALLLSVVADKTGYPAEMLAMHMELEADLGIDSIKRVEILSAMRKRAPNLPEVVASEMATLRTLGQIADYMRDRSGGAAAAKAEAKIEAQPAPAASAKSRIDRYEVLTREEAPSGLTMSGVLTARRLVVTNEATGVAQALVRALQERGVTAEVVSEVPADADAVIFLGGLRAIVDVDAAVAVNREAFDAARAVAAAFSRDGGAFVLVQDTGGDLGMAAKEPRSAWLAGVAALGRTAQLEWPKAAVKALDLERGGRSAEEIAAAIAEEIFSGGGALEVGLTASGERRVPEVIERAVGERSPILPRGSVVVASGGARGVTATALIALARHAQPRLVILGRSALEAEPSSCLDARGDAALKRALLDDARAQGRTVTIAEIGAQVARIAASREVTETLAAIKAAGGEARYLAVDVTDAERLRLALDEVRRDWGPITAVVHGAGVLADKRIEDKSPEQFDRVFTTKVGGLRALLNATEGDPLRAIILFSSVAARAGNVGQCDYAMANEVLNKVAIAERRRRGNACVVKAIGWGPWEGGMVTPALKGHFESMGVALIPLAEGADRFVAEIEGSPDATEVLIGGGADGSAIRGAAERTTHLAIAVSDRSSPWLADHRVAGRRVLPVAIAVEWFARAAFAFQGRPSLRLRDVKVLRGIKLPTTDASTAFTLGCREASGGSLDLTLHGPDGALHYRASAEPAAPTSAPRSHGSALAPWGDRPIYDGGLLFHGPRFQAIRSIEGASVDEIRATLLGARDLGWADEARRTDPAIVDGALQLALLWTRERLGQASLPMSIAAFEWHRAGPIAGPVLAILRGREADGARAVCDVWLEDMHGEVVGALHGVETIARPAEVRAPHLAETGPAS